jgi:tight adherence protein B
MKLLAGLLYFVAALLFFGMAAWVYLRAGRRSRQERLTLRLRALGVDETAIGFVSRERELGNPILRAVCHALWRSGVDAEPQVVGRALLLAAALVPVALLVLGPISGPVALFVTLMLIYGWLSQQAAGGRAVLV